MTKKTYLSQPRFQRFLKGFKDLIGGMGKNGPSRGQKNAKQPSPYICNNVFPEYRWTWGDKYEFVGNKAKGRISKRVSQEDKASQIFRTFLTP